MLTEHLRPVLGGEEWGGGGRRKSGGNHSPLLQSCTPPLFRRYYYIYLHLFLVVLTTRNIHPSISTSNLTFANVFFILLPRTRI